MTPPPKCPECSAVITRLNIHGVDGTTPTMLSWKCVVYSCPACNKAISVQMDPIALKNDTVREIKGS